MYISASEKKYSVFSTSVFQVRVDLLPRQLQPHLLQGQHLPHDRLRVGIQLRHHGAALGRRVGTDGPG